MPSDSYALRMTDILLGVLAFVAGALLCYVGQVVLRLVIPVWGAFAGFVFGAGLVAGFSEEHFLGTVLGWVLGLFFALVFGLLAYFFYAVGVVIATASFGFSIGAGLVVALGIDWNWVAVLLGMLVGAIFGFVAIVTDMPTLLLIGLSAIAGAFIMVAGLMLVFGAVDSADFSEGSVTSHLRDDWWWWVAFFVLALGGGWTQLSNVALARGTMRYDAATVGRRPAQPS